jgi:hypothetical protein
MSDNIEMKSLMESWRRLVLESDNELSPTSTITGSVKVKVSDEPDDEILDEWDKDKDHTYPSRKKRKRETKAHKPDRSSWVHGADELANGGLAKGNVGLSNVSLEESKSKNKKKQCHNYSPWHGKDGRFVNPDKEAGSYSMAKPDGQSPDDCDYGQTSRKSSNRSQQWVKRPCGRGAKYRCRDGSKKWQEGRLIDTEETSQVDEGKQEQLEAFLSGVISRELERSIQKHMNANGCSFSQLIQAMTAWSQAEKGGVKK